MLNQTRTDPTDPTAPTAPSAPSDRTGRPERRVRRTARRLMRRQIRRCRAAAAEAGMSTAEYAVGTIAACGFAAVLYKIVTSGAVRSALTSVIVRALHVPF